MHPAPARSANILISNLLGCWEWVAIKLKRMLLIWSSVLFTRQEKYFSFSELLFRIKNFCFFIVETFKDTYVYCIALQKNFTNWITNCNWRFLKQSNVKLILIFLTQNEEQNSIAFIFVWVEFLTYQLSFRIYKRLFNNFCYNLKRVLYL